MCKGAGMIMPNMATMIAVITTDVPIAAPDLSQALTAAVNKSFNKVTVDSDTSTNDTCFALASGAAAPDGPTFAPGTPAFDAFQRALDQLATTLARKMARPTARGQRASSPLPCAGPLRPTMPMPPHARWPIRRS